MSLKTSLAQSVGRASRYVLTRYTQGGSSLPGKLALQVDPNILHHLSKDYQVAIVTGTNGKTLTTALVAAALKDDFDLVVTNESGSNMHQGIVSTFLDAPKVKPGQKAIAILEVDEGSLKNVVTALQPDYFLFTNIFPDQLDRYGSTAAIYQLLVDAARQVPTATIVSNGDLPLFNSIELENPQVFYGFDDETAKDTLSSSQEKESCPQCGTPLDYSLHTYANLGNYACPECKLQRPHLKYTVNKLRNLAFNHSQFEIDQHPFEIPVAGLYNIYNALAAYSLARELNVKTATLQNSFTEKSNIFGRQDILTVKNKQVVLNIVKNPVGLNQVLDLMALDSHPFTLVVLMNNKPADGTDFSWIEEANFEAITSYPLHQVITGGMKGQEMTDRLAKAGISLSIIKQVNTHEAVVELIENSETDYVHVLANYTAMYDLGELLKTKGYL